MLPAVAGFGCGSALESRSDAARNWSSGVPSRKAVDGLPERRGKFHLRRARGAKRMSDAPAMQIAAPARSQRSGLTPSASHSQASEAAM